MAAAPRITAYDWGGGPEAMLAYGPDDGPVAVLALPLLEEANRTRAFANAILRALAVRGVAGVLPDLPGQGDSLVPLATMTLDRWRSAYRAMVEQLAADRRRPHSIAIRSGALLDLDGVVRSRWYLSPQDGPALAREWSRLRGTSVSRPDAVTPDRVVVSEAVTIAGNLVSADLYHEVEPAAISNAGERRIVRLTGDPRPADVHVDGPPLWRRSEPGNDPAMADRLADDIARWIARCGG